jgi:hypothetical protein
MHIGDLSALIEHIFVFGTYSGPFFAGPCASFGQAVVLESEIV